MSHRWTTYKRQIGSPKRQHWIQAILVANLASFGISVNAEETLKASVDLELATAAVDDGNYARAAIYFRRLVNQDPKDAVNYANLAMCHLRVPDSEKKALEAAEQALTLKPSLIEARSYKAWALYYLNRYDEAMKLIKQVVKESNEQAEAFALISLLEYRLNHLSAALAADNEHVRLYHDEPQAYKLRARTLKKLGRRQEADADFARAKQLEAEHNKEGKAQPAPDG